MCGKWAQAATRTTGPARGRSGTGGHLEVLVWARANGCEWDDRTCAWAAQNGHPEVLEWARANGCE